MFSPNEEKWKGLQPIPYNQEPNTPFYIDHGDNYGQAMDLFRAAMNQSEVSERVLFLTTFLISNAPSNPYLYWYREKILEKLGFNFQEEFDFTSKLCLNFLKPYQIWQHRKWLLERKPESFTVDETDFVQRILDLDCQNFHVWEYMYWVAEEFNKWEWLFEQTKIQIEKRLKNNSAWSMRYSSFVKLQRKPSEDIEFALEKLASCPSCQSCASYIKGLLDIDSSLAGKIKESLQQILAQTKNVPVLYLLAQIEEKEGNIEEYDRLIDQISTVDTMRTNFWHLMKSSSSRFT